MELRRIGIHPLFFAAGILSAFTGDFLLFLAAVLAALEHECAHAFAARRYGYALGKITLMPYGAVIRGDLSGISPRGELSVLLAGPLANAATGLFFVALWWLYPETYAYTDIAAYVSFSLFFVNLLPAWPLDGGRAVRVLLRPLGEKRCTIILRILTALTAAAVLGYFVVTCFSSPAWSALFFAVLLGAGAFGGAKYGRIVFDRGRTLRRGVEEMRVAISADAPLRAVFRFLREERYLTLLLFDGEEFFAELSEEEIFAALGRGDYGARLREFVSA